MLVLSGLGQTAAADAHRPDIEVWPDENEVPELTVEEFAETLEVARETVGQQLDDVARYIDSFFEDERLEGETPRAGSGSGRRS